MDTLSALSATTIAPRTQSRILFAISLPGSNININATTLVTTENVSTINSQGQFTEKQIQLYPYTIGTIGYFSFPPDAITAYFNDIGWVDENNTLWIKPEDGSIGNASSGATLSLSALELLFKRLHANSNCLLLDANGTQISKTTAELDWNSSYRLVIPSSLVPVQSGSTALICAGSQI